MLSQNTIIELRNDFVRKIREDWSSKWKATFGELGIDQPFPTSDKFLLALVADITETLIEKKIIQAKIDKLVPSTDTIKRHLKADNNEGMREKARECLALYLGYESYVGFVGRHNAATNATAEPEIMTPVNKKWAIGMGLVGSLIFAFAFILVYQKATPKSAIKPRIVGVHLSSDKAPITAKFDYDLGNMPFKSAYLDFEWKDSVGIDKQAKSVFYCFLHPTRRLAKLMVDGKCVDSVQVVIPSDGWMMGYEGIYYVDKNKWQKNGIARIAAADVLEESKKKGIYTSFIKKVGGFNDINCDNFNFEVSLKNPKLAGTTLCSDVTVTLIGSQNKLLLNLTQMGCSYFSYLKLNETFLGKPHSFQNLSINLNEFVKLNIKTDTQKAIILIDDKLAFTGKYSKKIGNLEAINVDFQNSGSVDYLKGLHSKTGKLLFSDDFEEQ